jgi:hypothetical protein
VEVEAPSFKKDIVKEKVGASPNDDDEFNKFFRNFQKYAQMEAIVRNKIDQENIRKEELEKKKQQQQKKVVSHTNKRQPVMDIIEKEPETFDYAKAFGDYAKYV